MDLSTKLGVIENEESPQDTEMAECENGKVEEGNKTEYFSNPESEEIEKEKKRACKRK